MKTRGGACWYNGPTITAVSGDFARDSAVPRDVCREIELEDTVSFVFAEIRNLVLPDNVAFGLSR